MLRGAWMRAWMAARFCLAFSHDVVLEESMVVIWFSTEFPGCNSGTLVSSRQLWGRRSAKSAGNE